MCKMQQTPFVVYEGNSGNPTNYKLRTKQRTQNYNFLSEIDKCKILRCIEFLYSKIS